MKAHFVFFSLSVLVCMSSGVWAADPPDTHNGFPTLDEGDGRFMNVVQGAASIGDVGAGTLGFSVCVDPGETDLSLWVFDGENTNDIPLGSFWDDEGLFGPEGRLPNEPDDS